MELIREGTEERTRKDRAAMKQLFRKFWYSPALLVIMVWVLGAPRKIGGKKL